MRRGGIYDHLGFGFHRYSTDARWLVPHFEKMLYDQAMLAMAYAEAYQAGGEPFRGNGAGDFRVRSRDMTAPEGGFYSAEDADSEGREGSVLPLDHGGDTGRSWARRTREFVGGIYGLAGREFFRRGRWTE